MNSPLHVAVIGGGAAGFFAAITAASGGHRVTLFERSNKVLAKVKVSGGGRCNVTHACSSPSALSKHYPRGEKQLRKAFGRFAVQDTVAWFGERGVELKTEDDGRMFPVTDSSQTIIDCLEAAAREAGVRVVLQRPVAALEPVEGGWHVDGARFDRVVVATGGSPKREGLAWLERLGHGLADPVPSLFTFNLPGEGIRRLMGVVVPSAIVRIQGTKLQEQGPVLVTHWGLSGPAVLKLSAWGARELADRGYAFTVQVNWVGERNEEAVQATLQGAAAEHARKQVGNACPFELPRKFWAYVLERAGIEGERTWADLARKQRNKLVDTLLNDAYPVRGKTTFKEEFVTCGGVLRSDVDFATMQSRVAPGLYFAGEVLDIDGVTGGFNFQAAWTTGFIAGQLA